MGNTHIAKKKVMAESMPELTLKKTYGNVMRKQITCSKDSEELFRELWDTDSLNIYETFMIIYVDRSLTTVGWAKVSQGSSIGTVVDIKTSLSKALLCLAHGMILCHNHPSGNLAPSKEDKSFVSKLKSAAELHEIQIIDSLILGIENDYYSFADEGML